MKSKAIIEFKVDSFLLYQSSKADWKVVFGTDHLMYTIIFILGMNRSVIIILITF